MQHPAPLTNLVLDAVTTGPHDEREFDMQDEISATGTSGRRRLGVAACLLAAGALAGGVLASTLSASATDSTASPSATGSASSADTRQGGPQGGPGSRSSSPVRGDEKALTAAAAAKVKAAALKAVAGGTVYRIETDAGDGAYEAHMTRADGTGVTVKVDTSFTVTAVEDGMGKGDPRPSDQPGGPGAGSGNSTRSA